MYLLFQNIFFSAIITENGFRPPEAVLKQFFSMAAMPLCLFTVIIWHIAIQLYNSIFYSFNQTKKAKLSINIIIYNKKQLFLIKPPFL